MKPSVAGAKPEGYVDVRGTQKQKELLIPYWKSGLFVPSSSRGGYGHQNQPGPSKQATSQIILPCDESSLKRYFLLYLTHQNPHLHTSEVPCINLESKSSYFGDQYRNTRKKLRATVGF